MTLKAIIKVSIAHMLKELLKVLSYNTLIYLHHTCWPRLSVRENTSVKMLNQNPFSFANARSVSTQVPMVTDLRAVEAEPVAE